LFLLKFLKTFKNFFKEFLFFDLIVILINIDISN
jgi:hypothetical protein